MSLEIKDLNKSFEKKKIFSNFSYAFPDIGLYAVLGESGVGKTTLLRMIAGLDTDYTGEILGGGTGNVSFAFQEYRLFPQINALDNVVYAVSDGKDATVVAEAKALLSELGFGETDMFLRPSEMSGGMKQRVSFARALIKKTSVLLLDEPTKELDADTAVLVIEKIREASKERLVIAVTHTPEELDAISTNRIIIEKAVE